jgi:peptidoglycan/xylan/chitin deacetylase (PgdA/CDA1 family)
MMAPTAYARLFVSFGCVGLLLVSLGAGQQDPIRRVAFTIDDLPTQSVLGNDLERAQKTTDGLLAALRRQNVPAIGFVNEGKLGPSGKADPARIALLQRWIDAGLELGNHTFSHLDLHGATAEAFEADIAKGDLVTRRLLDVAGRPLTFFRHPFLHTGNSAEVRAHVQAFLESRHYVVAPVTIDNYDYVFAAAYDRTVARSDAPAARRIEDAYLDYMLSVVAYYEQQSKVIVGRGDCANPAAACARAQRRHTGSPRGRVESARLPLHHTARRTRGSGVLIPRRVLRAGWHHLAAPMGTDRGQTRNLRGRAVGSRVDREGRRATIAGAGGELELRQRPPH